MLGHTQLLSDRSSPLEEEGAVYLPVSCLKPLIGPSLTSDILSPYPASSLYFSSWGSLEGEQFGTLWHRASSETRSEVSEPVWTPALLLSACGGSNRG